MHDALPRLSKQLEGSLHWDDLTLALYATDASVYRQRPLAVAYPANVNDLKALIAFANHHGIGLIPRTAGTSLAGQCVGSGIVIDLSKHFTHILEFNPEERWVKVQPGIIRDELNRFLAPHGLRFGPDTSTANRCMIGGMVGNNSCGASSIVYGSTRDHLLEVKALLSDGSEVVFGPLSPEALSRKMRSDSLEGAIYRHLFEELSKPEVADRIRRHFPRPEIHRRNTGYAVDLLLRMKPFDPTGPDLNVCTLLAGSEGTLALVTEIKLNLVPEPPAHHVLLCAHFEDIPSTMKAVVPVMRTQPWACELMDKVILDCTRANPAQRRNRFFLQGDPAAILIVEYRGEDARAQASETATYLRQLGLGFAFPIVEPPDTQRVWELRKAGLGLLGNLPGDAKAVACIEDTAVAIEDLCDYIGEFTSMMERFGQRAVYYAHAGAGEIHLRPILNLKKSEDVRRFREITEEVAKLVKKYGGSLSGEHGDGRVRSEFIPLVIGQENYALLRQIKRTWDPKGIFNPGKIVDPLPMHTHLRYEPDQPTPEYPTMLDFSADGGLLRHAEKCNGSGDCRKRHTAGGVMCPSYHATLDEKHTTRARANALREFLTHPPDQDAPFGAQQLLDVLDLCLSCKACSAECPSTVDMAALKAEVLHQHHQLHGTPWRYRLFGHISSIYAFAVAVEPIANALLRWPAAERFFKKMAGIHPQRSLPAVPTQTWMQWFNRRRKQSGKRPTGPRVVVFCDEFTNYTDVLPGIKAIELLEALGYSVSMPPCRESGRALISKGLLEAARRVANTNVDLFSDCLAGGVPIVGVEPSAILTFRDEYPKLVSPQWRRTAKRLAEHVFTLEEFLLRECEAGRIGRASFSQKQKRILVHAHCHQKALGDGGAVAAALAIPEGFEVELIQAGCCGMAGSFGYELEHYELSMQIAGLALEPAIEKAGEDVAVVAQGTSCRHQILDATGRRAFHPAELLVEALPNQPA